MIDLMFLNLCLHLTDCSQQSLIKRAEHSEGILMANITQREILRKLPSRDQVFSALDRLLEESGMYKYHHIANSYVVTCPHVSSPFDEHEVPCAAGCVSRMVQLGCALIGRAQEFHTASGQRLGLKVGIHLGPAAAAVVGRHKRFFCLFGDVVNTAARSELLPRLRITECRDSNRDIR